MEQTYDIKKLQTHFAGVLPYLTKNLGNVYDAYMKSDVAAGKYHYVLSRHANATALANIDGLPREELATDEDLFKAGSIILMDLENVLENLPGDEQADAKKRYDDLLAFYAENGFTEKHPIFETPVQPKTAAVI